MSKCAATLLGAVVLLVGSSVACAAPAQGAQGPQRQAEPAERARQEPAERARQEQAEIREKKETREHAPSETAAEMQARREERKEIQEQYREARQEGEVPKAGKKPWWKFWGSDEEG